MATKIKKLLFIDTNIWLDFYRSPNETGLALLRHAEQVADRIIVTYQLESEFKANRQSAIAKGLEALAAPKLLSRPGIFSDAQAPVVINNRLREVEKRVNKLRAKYVRALSDPAAHDTVYQICQRIFHKADTLCLTREMRERHLIRRKAMRRFLHGCPPRKRGDTSIGDAINWEWMIYCATNANAELVIVSRDGDYGQDIERKTYVNDHLLQEFRERVSQKRKLLLYRSMSDALRHFDVSVTKKEEAGEEELVREATTSSAVAQDIADWFGDIKAEKLSQTQPLPLGDILKYLHARNLRRRQREQQGQDPPPEE